MAWTLLLKVGSSRACQKRKCAAKVVLRPERKSLRDPTYIHMCAAAPVWSSLYACQELMRLLRSQLPSAEACCD
jgi:hypothetical protein